jgi:RNA polymerase sigma factor (sigma-70 family)
MAGTLGEVLDQPLDPNGRALILDWGWWRPRKELLVQSDNGSLSGGPTHDRRRVRFRLRAYARRQGQAGQWVLTVWGHTPENPGANLVVDLSGWGLQVTDQIASITLLQEPTEIALTRFSDPTPIFADWGGGTALVTVKCEGRAPWHVSEEIPGPLLDREFYQAWAEHSVDGMNSCLARLVAIISRQGLIRDPHLVYEALEESAREIYRRRYVYREINSFDDFSRLVVAAARKRYRQFFRGLKAWPGLLSSDPPDPRPAESDGMVREEIQKALNDCVEQLSPSDRALFELRFREDLPYREIGYRLDLSEGTARVRHFRMLRYVAECLSRKGYGHEDLIAFS